MENTQVVVHSMDNCGYCAKARDWLASHGISFEEVKHPDAAERQTFYDQLGLNGGQRTMPQIFLRDTSTGEEERIGGFQDLEDSGLA